MHWQVKHLNLTMFHQDVPRHQLHYDQEAPLPWLGPSTVQHAQSLCPKEWALYTGQERGTNWKDVTVLKRKTKQNKKYHSAGQYHNPPPARLCLLISLCSSITLQPTFSKAWLIQHMIPLSIHPVIPEISFVNFRSANRISVKLFKKNKQKHKKPHTLALTQVSDDTCITEAFRYTH